MDSVEYENLVQKYSRLRPQGSRAAVVLFGVSLVSALGLALTFSSSGACWFLGQILLGISMVQWFVLLHDFGHGSFFTRPWLNDCFGLFASNICLLPFYPWRYIHAKHHVWTGWKDLDPTMTVRGALSSPVAKSVADFSWRFWIPIFSISFSVYNFWNPQRLFRLWPDPKVT